MLGDSRLNAKKILEYQQWDIEDMLTGYFLTVIGLICFFEGLPYLASPDHLKKVLERLIRTPSRALRLLGGALMVLGLILVYWGRHYAG